MKADFDRIYAFIESYVQENEGMSPSLREIAEGCHYNRSTVDRYLWMLQAQGRVKRDPRRARSIRLVKPNPES